MFSDATVVILAAGQGTRMKSRLAKVLHEAGGKPLIQHAIAAALAIAPPERIFVVVGHQAEAVRREAEGAGVNTIVQSEQLGTGHALMCGENQLAQLGGRLAIVTGDCPLILPSTLAQLLDVQASGVAGALITTEVADPAGYGRILRAEDGSIAAIVEHKAATAEQRAIPEINAGFYCFDAGLFWNHIGDIRPDNPAREYYLTDMVGILIGKGHRILALNHPDSTELLGINNRIELAAADRILRARKVRDLMLEGVTIEKPETVTADSGVRIGMDSIIGPFSQITGNTAIGENCRVGAGSIVHDSILGDGVEVFPYSVITSSTLEAGAQAGPFARIRMGAHLEAGAHVGNFVELKKTRLGAGAKSMHLAYLGDASIGAKSNIGAGTITCNYDGSRKHPTGIGAGVFVGSNSTLVAPVEIAEGAYIAAGSVITDNVPPKTLALAARVS